MSQPTQGRPHVGLTDLRQDHSDKGLRRTPGRANRGIRACGCDVNRCRATNGAVGSADGSEPSVNRSWWMTQGSDGEDGPASRAPSRYDVCLPALRSRSRHCRTRPCRHRGHDVSRNHEARSADALLAGVFAAARRRHGGRCALHRRVLGFHRAVYPLWVGDITFWRAAVETGCRPTTQTHGRLVARSPLRGVNRHKAPCPCLPCKGSTLMKRAPRSEFGDAATRGMASAQGALAQPLRIPEGNGPTDTDSRGTTPPSPLAHRWQLRFLATAASRPVDYQYRQAGSHITAYTASPYDRERVVPTVGEEGIR